MDYAIIKLGNKQHRVRDGETLVVDRLPTEEGKSFEPVVLLGDTKVTATVLAHGRGPKILIGKYRKRTGYKRHNGFRAATTQVEIALGAGGARRAAAKAAPPKQAEKPKAEAVEVETPSVEAVEAAPEETTAPEAPETAAAGGALPAGYEGMTVAQIAAAAKEWGKPELEAALAHEQAGAARKGALAALQSALAKEAD
jgi:large subunit ribosomal protein L21